MSGKTLFIVASLAINVVLGIVWWQRAGDDESNWDLRDDAARGEQIAGGFTAKTEEVPAMDWATLTAAVSDGDFVAGLKREGFPPRIIREMLRVRLGEKHADRFRELQQRQPVAPYWRSRPPAQEIDLEARAKLRALNQEITNEIKQLLGSDIFQMPGDYAHESRERMYGPIPPEKIAGIEAINADYSELANQIREAARGVIFPEDREKLSFLERERQADLVRMLTPAELTAYEMRNSPTATGLKSQLRHFAPSEEEFVAMYNVQRAFDDRYGRTQLSGKQEDRRRDARPELFAAMETALGEERFEDYRLMTDGNFGGTSDVVKSIGLPVESAKDLVRIQQMYNRLSETAKKEIGPSPEQRSAQLAALAAEARGKVAEIVGAEHLSAYEGHAGQWLGQISPPPVRTSH